MGGNSKRESVRRGKGIQGIEIVPMEAGFLLARDKKKMTERCQLPN